MEDYIKETLIASPYPFWLTVLIFALVTGLVQCIVFYFKEKGKNLATKEDIAGITKEIESVKASYNESLERHKIELQKEFEKSKYSISLYQKIDEKLIEILLECHILSKEAISIGGIEVLTQKDIEGCLNPLFYYLTRYSTRYGINPIAHDIIKLSEQFEFIAKNKASMNAQAQVEGYDFDFKKDYFEISSKIFFASSQLLSELLPPMNNNKPEH